MRRFALILLLLAAARPLLAAESAPVSSKRLTATLVTDTDAVAEGRPFRLGLRLQMAPGWHTYWQNPGDAGQPPELTLTLPQGTAATPVEWPAPQRLAEGPIMTYAYTGEVLLPLTVTPGAGPQTIKATANWLVCQKICVPEEGNFTLDVPAGTPAPSAEAKLFTVAETRMPRPSPFTAIVGADGTLALTGAGLSAASVKDAWFFPATWGLIDQAAAQTPTVRDGEVRIALQRGEQFAKAASLPGVVALRDPAGQETFLQIDAPRGTLAADAAVSWPRILLFAALGGLLLNLMPCVFPVLAMKALALARLSGKDRGEARAQAWFYTSGVLVAFAGMGGALLAARGAGAVAGWGFQFQSPLFVAAMAWLLFLVGLNLSGVFEIGGRFAGAGQGLATRGGHAGSFFTGFLAVLVATPCTAPFMAAAIAAALAAPATLTLLVFLVMGLGMALPYLLLGLFPAWARRLPRPGPWMDVFRGALAFPMYGATAWLVWVLSLQAGSDGVLAAVAGLVLLGLGAWAFGLAQRIEGLGRRFGQVVAVASVAGAAVVLTGIVPSPAAAQASTETAERFTPDRLAELRAQGRPVFVNMTAAWCVTCLVNEKVALSPNSVREAFAKHGVVYLKGDWTSGDKFVTQFLHANGRDGVPLYLLYPTGSGAPTVLPQILTEGEILSQLDKMGG